MNRDFAALWTGQAISALGATASGTAMPLLVLALTGDPATAGLVGAAGGNAVFQALGLTLVVLAQRHGTGPAGIGLMLGLYSGGGLAGAIAATRLHRHLTARTMVVGVNWVWAALLPALLVADGPVGIGLIGAACAFVGPLPGVVLMTYAGTLVPNELLGRVTSAAMTISWGVMPLASVAGGYALTRLGPVGTIGLLAVLMLAIAVAGTLTPSLRRLPAPVGSGR
ncbi:hypothetical protein [Actinoplanes sp. NPDC051851]|uniref:hypothetical protein n=1 Tax=Actinoplanes sp. NPDC051851 TaxID=3154753 RepID=UPI0034349676